MANRTLIAAADGGLALTVGAVNDEVALDGTNLPASTGLADVGDQIVAFDSAGMPYLKSPAGLNTVTTATTTNLTGLLYADGANIYSTPVDAFEPVLPATPAAPTTKFLDGNRAWNVPPYPVVEITTDTMTNLTGFLYGDGELVSVGTPGSGAWISGLVGSTGSSATICSGTAPADGGFEVGGILRLTAYTGGALAVYCDYTNILGTAVTTQVIPVVTPGSSISGAVTGSPGLYNILVTGIYAKSGTTITLRTWTTGTLTYNAQGWVKKM